MEEIGFFLRPEGPNDTDMEGVLFSKNDYTAFAFFNSVNHTSRSTKKSEFFHFDGHC